MKRLEISREWLLRMADKEDNGSVSVGGLVARIDKQETMTDLPPRIEALMDAGSSDGDWDRSRAGWKIVGSKDAVLLIESPQGHRETITLWPMLPDAAKQAIENYRAGDYDGEDILALVNFTGQFLI